MGGMILMILFTILICGGVPYLAFTYMNKKAKTAGDKEKANRKVIILTLLILGIFFNCFLFPVYNFTHGTTHGWRWHGVFIPLAAFFELGILLAGAIPYKKSSSAKTILTLVSVNCIHIFIGIGCRYLLEFGEVSNTYNFTVPNMVFHIVAVNAFCVASWYFAVTQHPKSTQS